jgi:RHS repeat-associated protein
MPGKPGGKNGNNVPLDALDDVSQKLGDSAKRVADLRSRIQTGIRDVFGPLGGPAFGSRLDDQLGRAQEALSSVSNGIQKASTGLRNTAKSYRDTDQDLADGFKNIDSKPDLPSTKPGGKPDLPGGPGSPTPGGKKPDMPDVPGGPTKPSGASKPDLPDAPSAPTSPSGAPSVPKSDMPSAPTSPSGAPSVPKSDMPSAPTSSSGAPSVPKSDMPDMPSSTSRGMPDGDTPRGGPDPAKTKEPGQKDKSFDPIDVVTGDVLLTEVDLVVPGALGELIIRNHVSSYRDGRWFGPSWTSLVDESLTFVDGSARYHSADAMVLSFQVPVPGTPTTPAYGPPRQLHTDGTDYVVTDPARGLHRRFVRSPGGNDEYLLHEVRADSGEFVELERDADGAPALLTHSSGARIAFDVADGRIRTVRALSNDADVLVASYDYDEHGHLARRANSTPRPAQYEHDAEGRLLGWIDHNGAWYRYVYDSEGRCVRAVGDQGYLDGALNYAADRTTTTDSLGHQMVYEFDGVGNVVAVIDKLGGVTRREWGPHNLLLARTDPLGRRTEFEHDDAGILRSVTRPDGSRVRIVERTETTLRIEITDGERTYRRHYSAPTLPDPYTEPLGTDISPADPAGTDAGGQDVPGVELDLFGRARVLRDAGGRTELTWTVEGQLRALVRPDGARQQWTHDGEGQVSSYIDPLNRVANTEYGPFGTITATTGPDGARTTHRYDGELRLVAVTNPAGQTWEYTFDAEGRMTAQSDFDGRVTRYDYDAAGQLVRMVNPAGEVVEYTYDQLGNRVARTSAAGTETYRYDPLGRLVHATGVDTELELERDDEDRVVRQTVGGRVTTFEYAGDSSSTRRTPSGVDVSWERAGEGVDTLVVAGTTLVFQHDAAGRPVAVTSGVTPLVRQEFDAAGRLSSQRSPAGLRRYHRRADGSVASREDPAGGARYEFDPAGRISAVHSPNAVERYAYDVVGNLVSSSPGTGAEAGPRRYDGGVLLAAGAVRYVHDALGRLVRRTVADPMRGELTWTFTWDAQDNLTGVRTPDGTRWRYRYDPLDRRVAKQRLDPAGGIAEQVDFVWDGNAMIEARHTVGGVLAGTLTWVYHPDDGRPVVQVFTAPDGSTTLAALVTDDVGTPVELVAADTGAVRPLRTSLYGLVRAGDGDATPLRFPGQYHDLETGLHFNVYRYYDPANGRYISPDPLGLDPAPNPLTYVNDPLTASDPLGLTGRGSGSDRLAMKYAAQAAGDGGGGGGGGGGQPIRQGLRQRCKKAMRGFNPLARPKGKTAGSTASTPPQSGGFGAHQAAIDKPTGKIDPVTGRTESQGGGTTSGGPHTLDGRQKLSTSSTPGPGENTDVIELLAAARNGTLSPELKAQLADLGWDPATSKGDPFIRGHLQNDNLGGPGTSDNLTPLSSVANGRMSKSFEEQLKTAEGSWLRTSRIDDQTYNSLVARVGEADAKTIRDELNDLKVEYKVDVSDTTKFPNSPNPFERSIRDHLVLEAKWSHELSDVTKAYLLDNGKLKTMPIFPPPGTKMDTITGEMRDPDGNIYDMNAAKNARKDEYNAAADNYWNAMDTSS